MRCTVYKIHLGESRHLSRKYFWYTIVFMRTLQCTFGLIGTFFHILDRNVTTLPAKVQSTLQCTKLVLYIFSHIYAFLLNKKETTSEIQKKKKTCFAVSALCTLQCTKLLSPKCILYTVVYTSYLSLWKRYSNFLKIKNDFLSNIYNIPKFEQFLRTFFFWARKG